MHKEVRNSLEIVRVSGDNDIEAVAQWSELGRNRLPRPTSHDACVDPRVIGNDFGCDFGKECHVLTEPPGQSSVQTDAIGEVRGNNDAEWWHFVLVSKCV